MPVVARRYTYKPVPLLAKDANLQPQNVRAFMARMHPKQPGVPHSGFQTIGELHYTHRQFAKNVADEEKPLLERCIWKQKKPKKQKKKTQ